MSQICFKMVMFFYFQAKAAIFVTIATEKVKLNLGYFSNKLIRRIWCKQFFGCFFGLNGGGGKIAFSCT